jgi:hypothetical protein
VVVVGSTVSTPPSVVIGQLTPVSVATCGAGSSLLGGGADVTNGGAAIGAMEFSKPDPSTGTPTGWQAEGVVTVTGAGTVTVTAYAICSA